MIGNWVKLGSSHSGWALDEKLAHSSQAWEISASSTALANIILFSYDNATSLHEKRKKAQLLRKEKVSLLFERYKGRALTFSVNFCRENALPSNST